MCFQETKTDDLDEINIEGFEIIMKNRFKYGRVDSGGIILAFRQNLSEFITTHATDSKTVLWFEISKRFTNLEKNLLVGIVYISPENSKYSCRDSFSMIELEMQELSADDKQVILTGDFNARTGTVVDFYDIETEGKDQFSEIFQTMETEPTFTSNDRLRNNEDKAQNTYGKLLIELCKNKKLLIVNGRIGDNSTGRLTCKNSSVVDYFLCDYIMYKYVSNVRVIDQSSLFLDVHTPIVLYLNIQKNTSSDFSKQKVDCVQNFKSWDPS